MEILPRVQEHQAQGFCGKNLCGSCTGRDPRDLQWTSVNIERATFRQNGESKTEFKDDLVVQKI
jgi:hypothetical protein